MLERKTMLRFAALAALGIGLGVAAFQLFVRPEGPRIRVSTRDINFGRVAPGGLSEKTVTIRNGGSEPLHIENIKLSCGCSRAKLDKSVILAGEEAELRLSVEGTTARRTTVAKAAVISNDPNTPVLELSMQFSTLEDIWVEPTSIDFGRVAKETLPQSKLLRIHLDADSKIKPFTLRCSTSNEHLSAILKPTDDARAIDVAVGLLASAPSGQHRSSVNVRTNDGSTSISVEVHATVRGEAFAMPPALVLGPLDKGMGGESLQIITIRRRDGQPATLNVHLNQSLADILDINGLAPGELDVRLRSFNSIQHVVEGAILVEVHGEEFQVETVTIPVTIIWKTDRLKES
ncbi:MAG: DUF1573 domain-containing protein [Planctomycetota bacterium]|nr:DUF1573 domain-containing protein [Planctomycetota bacterium]